MWQFVKNVAWDDPAHEFQFQSRQRIADAVAKSQTFYGKTLVGRVNRALDRADYDLPEHMGSSIAQNVADESEGKITQSQAHAREAGMFGGHLIKEGLLGGNKEARDPIFALGATLNATGAVASRAAELYARNPDDDTRPPWYD